MQNILIKDSLLKNNINFSDTENMIVTDDDSPFEDSE